MCDLLKKLYKYDNAKFSKLNIAAGKEIKSLNLRKELLS